MNSPQPFPKAEALSGVKDPMDWTQEKCALMVEACQEMAIFHQGYCAELKWIYLRHGFDPTSIEKEEDLKRIPVLGVTAMKHFLLTSLPHERAVLKLTSSGTRGQKTQIWFDLDSLDRVQRMLQVLWEEEGLVSQNPTNYLMFVYDPEDAQDMGIAFSDKNQQRFAPALESFYALKKNSEGEWEFKKEEAIRKSEEFVRKGSPIRVFGIPSFVYEFLEELQVRNRAFVFPEGSWMVVGGGWKAAEDKKVSREFFRKRVTGLLGIPSENIRDGYGMAEHSAPYIDCRNHRFHVPVYNRILVKDPVTLEELPPGQTGLLELITPFNAMMPNLAVLSTDLGYMDPDSCDCGHTSPTFTLVGRGGLTKHKGCALQAAEIVKRG